MRTCQPTAGLTSTSPQTEVNHHSAILGENNLPLPCWLSRLQFPLQISNYPNSTRFWVNSDPIHLNRVTTLLGLKYRKTVIFLFSDLCRLKTNVSMKLTIKTSSLCCFYERIGLQIEEAHSLYGSSNIIMVVKIRRLGWKGHIA